MEGFGQFLAGAALLLAFLQLSRRSVRAIILLAAAQAGLLALAAAAAGAWWVALLVLAGKAVLLPAALWKAAPDDATDTGIGVIASLLAGGALLALAIAVALPIAPGGLALSRQELALALAVLLLGLLMLATRRHPLAQAAGLMGAENAVLLAAIGAGLPGLLPLVAPMTDQLTGPPKRAPNEYTQSLT
ncbi:MAG: hypothetical protein NTW56_06090 [Alphaproteobacteria bacterium]|nr:hypothetical protein [Alphaproteobacteria bacterium]